MHSSGLVCGNPIAELAFIWQVGYNRLLVKNLMKCALDVFFHFEMSLGYKGSTPQAVILILAAKT